MLVTCCSFPFPVSSTGTETRQFYDLYNSSVDERDFMEKEVCEHVLLVTLVLWQTWE